MAQASRNERRHRRVKNNLRLQKKQTRDNARMFVREAEERRKVFAVLQTVLAQLGGEVVVTKGTIENVNKHLDFITYELKKSDVNEGEWLIVQHEDKEAIEKFDAALEREEAKNAEVPTEAVQEENASGADATAN